MPQLANCPLVWQLYLRLEISSGRLEAAHRWDLSARGSLLGGPLAPLLSAETL
jgi:hypothetical protein